MYSACARVSKTAVRGPCVCVASQHLPFVLYNMFFYALHRWPQSSFSCFLLMAVTAMRNHWRAVACVPWMAMTQSGTASAETAWLTTPTVKGNSMRTAHLLENIPDPGTEVLSASPIEPAQSLHKAGLQIKQSFQGTFFSSNSASLALNIGQIIKHGGIKMTQMRSRQVLPEDWKGQYIPVIHISVKTMWVFVHTVREWTVSCFFWMILLMIIKCFFYLIIFNGVHWFLYCIWLQKGHYFFNHLSIFCQIPQSITLHLFKMIGPLRYLLSQKVQFFLLLIISFPLLLLFCKC